MSTIYFIRHGQASFGEDDYDNLSSLGEEQSYLLGKHFLEQEIEFDHIIIGGLNRHRQTLDALLKATKNNKWNQKPAIVLHTLNEYNHVEILNAYLKKEKIKSNTLTDARLYFKVMQKALLAWSQDSCSSHLQESWVDFENRILYSLEKIVELSAKKDKVLVISSGGPICCAIKYALGISAEKCIELIMQTRNTSCSQFYISKNSLILESFNNIAHLENRENKNKTTYS